MPKNQNDWSNRHDLFKNFLIFRFISKSSSDTKHLYSSVFLIRRTPEQVFPCEVFGFLRILFFTEYLRWLLLRSTVMCDLFRCFQVNSCFLFFSVCCERCLPWLKLGLYYEKMIIFSKNSVFWWMLVTVYMRKRPFSLAHILT